MGEASDGLGIAEAVCSSIGVVTSLVTLAGFFGHYKGHCPRFSLACRPAYGHTFVFNVTHWPDLVCSADGNVCLPLVCASVANGHCGPGPTCVCVYVHSTSMCAHGPGHCHHSCLWSMEATSPFSPCRGKERMPTGWFPTRRKQMGIPHLGSDFSSARVDGPPSKL